MSRAASRDLEVRVHVVAPPDALRPDGEVFAVGAAGGAEAAAQRRHRDIAPAQEPLHVFGGAVRRGHDLPGDAGAVVDDRDGRGRVALGTADVGVEQTGRTVRFLHGNPVRLLAPAPTRLARRAGAGRGRDGGGAGGEQSHRQPDHHTRHPRGFALHLRLTYVGSYESSATFPKIIMDALRQSCCRNSGFETEPLPTSSWQLLLHLTRMVMTCTMSYARP